ncbi:hypothetical protein DWB67_09985 [Paracoccus sp. JM45]|nr:hypothetical protein DWB67_09985 [Paracoccus sp. JM45]
MLHYKPVALGNTQRRLNDRIALVPIVDLDAYRFHAVIDWVEFRIHLGRPTQAQHVQAVLRRYLARDSFIAPEDGTDGSVFTVCTIKVQEPSSFALIHVIHRALCDRFGEASSARVTGLEVSVDAYVAENANATRAHLLGALQRTIWTSRDILTNSNSRLRSVWKKQSDGVQKLLPELQHDDARGRRANSENHRAPFIDGTMYLGARHDDVMLRLMEKVKDRQRFDGSYDDLNEPSKRVRIEVTLKGSELTSVGITDIASLRRLKLTSMQGRYFQFKLPTFKRHVDHGLSGTLQAFQEEERARVFHTTGVMGLSVMDSALALQRKRSWPGVRKNLRSMNRKALRTQMPRLAAPFIAFERLNMKVSLALRSLQKREDRSWSRMTRQSVV